MVGIAELGGSIASVAERVGSSLVGVGHRWGMGSGVVISEGRVLTNAHNVGSNGVEVIFADGRRAGGRPLGVDVDGDVAVLGLDTGEAEAMPWSEERPGVGTPVVALANPGGRGLRVTLGFVSGVERSFSGPRGRTIRGSFEHTAPLLPGSSGGPVADMEGRLLGINTSRLGSGFYLAIPADATLRRAVDELAQGRAPRRPRLGVGLAPAAVASRLRQAVGLPDAEGLLVRTVEPDSPAARAGLRKGDLIVGAGGRRVVELEDLVEALAPAPSSIDLQLMRGTDELTVEVRFADGAG